MLENGNWRSEEEERIKFGGIDRFYTVFLNVK